MYDIKEWISDNLRYIILGAALIVVILLAVAGVRAITNLGSNGTADKTETETTASTDTIVDGDSTGDTATLVQNDADILTMMTSYYTARTNKDIDTLKKLDPSIDEEEEKASLESSYVESYSNIKTYSKQGPTDDSCVVYVCYDGKVENIDTLVPSLTQFYLTKDADGNYIISDPTGDAKAESFIEETKASDEVQKLINTVSEECAAAEESDPVLKEFLAKYGNSQDGEDETEADDSSNGEMVVSSEVDSLNVRSDASNDSDENIIGALLPGDTVTVLSESDGWAEIEYDGESAYVSSEFLTAADAEAESESETESTDDTSEEDYFSPDYTGDTTDDGTAA